jgi:hypothetical protein
VSLFQSKNDEIVTDDELCDKDIPDHEIQSGNMIVLDLISRVLAGEIDESILSKGKRD